MAIGSKNPILGIIGGSGIYDIEGIEDIRVESVVSPFGPPSDDLVFGNVMGQEVVFLPRHGRGHNIPPSDINYLANIDVMKRAGCTEILSLSAVGSLKEELCPGTFVIVDQFIDRTFDRKKSFFGKGLVAHVSMADPVCGRLGGLIQRAATKIRLPIVRGGTYLVMEGPQFSSRAESELYRSWNCDVIGMTNMPEAKLAREAEMCYATVAMVTDYDCWHLEHDNVNVETVINVLHKNAATAKELLKALIPMISERKTSCAMGCHQALAKAIVTPKEARDPNMVKKLDAVADGYL